MVYLDKHPEIQEWASEEFFIPYYNPIKKKISRYFPDFWVRKKDGSCIVVEIKPSSQTGKPQSLNEAPSKENKKKRKRIARDTVIYKINKAKWDSAEKFCKDKKWNFKIITEKELNIKGKYGSN